MKSIWEAPEIQSLNRLPMRSPLLPFESPEKATLECALGPESYPSTKSAFVMSLDGTWDFKLLDSPAKDFSTISTWDKIKVPGTWTLQGFDKPHYTNVQMPFDILPPNVPEENPTGIYHLHTKIPQAWKNRRVVLHIGSAESTTIVYINNTEVGISKDTRLPCEFDITPYIKDSNIEITIKVIRYSDASFVEDQDQWWFGGIHRSVFLYSTENTFIQDVSALSRLKEMPKRYDEATDKPLLKADAILPLNITLGYSDIESEVTHAENKTLDNLSRIVKYKLQKLDGTAQKGEIGKTIASGEIQIKYNYRANLNQGRIEIPVTNAFLWSTEHPELYLITVSLYEIDKAKKERHIESVSFTTGFKSVEIKNRELLMNGKMVYIKGVNRHEHSEYFGKTIPLENMIRDAHLLKEYNFNAVRTCHYPDDERWYEICDRYGIYLLDEANIENHAYYDCIARNDEYTNAYMTRVQRMVRRDKNHVSIFGYSLGNESGDGQNQIACQAWIRRTDPTRLVHYEGFVRPQFTQGDFTLDSLARGKYLTDFIGPMYPSIELITEYTKKCDDYRPIIMCEYSHAMGNANGSLADYWKAIRQNHGLQGGFIWDWIDQGIASDIKEENISENAKQYYEKHSRPNIQGGKYWKYGGDFGDTPSDYDFCLNGILFPDQTPKPAMQECKKLFAPIQLIPIHPEIGIFEIENRFDFSSLQNILLKWSLLENGKCVKEAILKLPTINPDSKVQIVLPIDTYKKLSIAEYYLHAEFIYKDDTSYATANTVLGMDEILLQKSSGYQLFPHEKLIAQNNDYKNLLSIVDKLEPTIFRAFLENECVKREIHLLTENFAPWSLAKKPTIQWLNENLAYAKIIQKVISTTINEYEIVSSTEKKADKEKSLAKIIISKTKTLSPTNTDALNLEITFVLSKTLDEYPRAGITIPLDAIYDKVTWYGNGPQECYSDRKDGALHGLYTLAADELEVPYIVPQENGSRCGTTYLCLTSSKANVLPLQLQSLIPFSFNYSKYTNIDLWECEHRNELTDLSRSKNAKYLLTIDAAHRGVGTGACGPDSREEYRVRPGCYTLNLLIW